MFQIHTNKWRPLDPHQTLTTPPISLSLLTHAAAAPSMPPAATRCHAQLPPIVVLLLPVLDFAMPPFLLEPPPEKKPTLLKKKPRPPTFLTPHLNISYFHFQYFIYKFHDKCWTCLWKILNQYYQIVRKLDIWLVVVNATGLRTLPPHTHTLGKQGGNAAKPAGPCGPGTGPTGARSGPCSGRAGTGAFQR